MNFNDIKASLESEEGAPQVPDRLAKLKDKNSPIKKIRRRLFRSQIYYVFICLLCFDIVNSQFDGLLRTIAIIVLALAIALSATYKLRIFKLLRKTKSIQDQTRKTLQTFIQELEIFIEVYKTSAIGMGLFIVLCIPLFAGSFYNGFMAGINNLPRAEGLTLAHESSLKVSNYIASMLTETNLLVIIAVVLALSFTVYQYNIYILNRRYGKPLKELKDILASLDE